MNDQISMFLDENDLEKKRNYIVTKDNRLIQKASYDLTMQQQKFLLYAISLIKPTDEKGKRYYVSIPEMCRICGIDNTRGNYQAIYKTVEKIKKNGAFYFKPTGSTKRMYIDWIVSVEFEETDTTQDIEKAIPRAVSFCFDNRLEPYLFDLYKNFTAFELQNILPMKSAFSVRLYEILHSFSNVGEKTFTLDELCDLLSVKKYERFNNFNRRVIQKALTEINCYTDLQVEDEQIRSGHQVTAVKFIITRKNTVKSAIAHARGSKQLHSVKKSPEITAYNDRMIKALEELPDE